MAPCLYHLHVYDRKYTATANCAHRAAALCSYTCPQPANHAYAAACACSLTPLTSMISISFTFRLLMQASEPSPALPTPPPARSLRRDVLMSLEHLNRNRQRKTVQWCSIESMLTTTWFDKFSAYGRMYIQVQMYCIVATLVTMYIQVMYVWARRERESIHKWVERKRVNGRIAQTEVSIVCM